MNIAFPFLAPACPPSFLFVYLSVYETTWPNASFLFSFFVVSSGNIQFGYMSTAGEVGGTLHSKTPTVSGSKC